MNRTVLRKNAAGLGIECPNCRAVFFLEDGKNQHRIYFSYDKDGKQRWKLLCICGEQTSFQKRDVVLYGATSGAREKGYAVQSEWTKSSRRGERGDMLRAFSEAFGLSVQEFSQIIVEERTKAEKGRH